MPDSSLLDARGDHYDCWRWHEEGDRQTGGASSSAAIMADDAASGRESFGIAAYARSGPGRVAVVHGDRRVSYRELDTIANRIAKVLRRRGISPRDRVSVALRNRPEFFASTAAIARLGAEVVQASWRLRSEEMRYIADDSDLRLIIAEPDARETMKGLPTVFLDDLLAEIDREEGSPPDGSLDPAPTAYRAYTSGTTGQPKAVEGTRLQAMQRSSVLGYDHPEAVHLACGPLYHAAPFVWSQRALSLGQPVVLMEHFDAEDCLRLIERERVSWTHMVPTNFVRIARLPEGVRTGYDLSSIRRVLHSAAPCAVDVKRQIIEIFPPGSVWEIYGFAELRGLATVISPEEWLQKPGSVGRPVDDLNLRILDDNGAQLPPGEVGLIFVSQLSGLPFAYEGAPAKTAAAFRGDLFTVGDMGYLDEDGYLFLADRQQDMIISGGANIYPAEVEAVLLRHPAVSDVAVIGTPDDEWGESVAALVELCGSVTADELITMCRDNIAHYKCPRTVHFVGRLPRDPNGKVRKRELRGWVRDNASPEP
jgi:long-chain acyl-CoA synthetase